MCVNGLLWEGHRIHGPNGQWARCWPAKRKSPRCWGIFFHVRPVVAKAYAAFVATCVPNTKTKLLLDAVGFTEGFGAQAIGFDVVDELHLVGIQFDLAIEE